MQIVHTMDEKTIVRSEATGFFYAIFASDLCNILLGNTVVNGSIQGTWMYVRHGNWGVTLIT